MGTRRTKGSDRSNRWIGGTNPYSMNVLPKKAKRELRLDGRVDFGKYVGMTVKKVLDIDPRYFLWLKENTDRKISDEVIVRARKIILGKK